MRHLIPQSCCSDGSCGYACGLAGHRRGEIARGETQPGPIRRRRPEADAWIPFGGGVNRCVGAAFANMEMDVTLRTLLRELRFAPTDAPDERRRWRGVATVSARGARAVVYRRTSGARSDVDSASVAEHGNE